MRPDQLIAELKRYRVPHDEIAEALGRSRPAATKLLSGSRALKAHEIDPLVKLLDRRKRGQVDAMVKVAPFGEEPGDTISYVPIPILPTFAGMGGGGTADAEQEHGLVPRYLIEDVLRGRPEDFILVRTRGDSMEPDFRQDDELLCDRRDRSPVQPGPFAIYDAEDDAYVVKNVEKLPDGRVRIFSSNPKYSPTEVTREETRILGRPVWYGRRL